jgi:RES domain-containing protein
VTFKEVFQKKTPGAPHRGSYIRAIPLQFAGSPLSAIGSLRAGGRYNARGAFEVLYLADRPDNALREIEMLPNDTGVPTKIHRVPTVIFSVRVRLQRVVDLTQDATRDMLGVSFDELVAPWRLIVAFGRVPMTHRIGAAARGAGLEGLIVPSARQPRAKNLVVFRDCLLRGSSADIRSAKGFGAGINVRLRGSLVARGSGTASYEW